MFKNINDRIDYKEKEEEEEKQHDELTSFTIYVVSYQGEIYSLTDTFAQAIENAEAKVESLINLAKQNVPSPDDSKKQLAILADSAPEPDAPGYYGHWEVYDEKAGVAHLSVKCVSKRPDGYIFEGSLKRRPFCEVRVHSTTVDLFDGFYVPTTKTYNDDDDDLSEE